MRIVIVTDAWSPQVNGVVTTMRQTRDHLEARGHEVLMITPDLFKSIAGAWTPMSFLRQFTTN